MSDIPIYRTDYYVNDDAVTDCKNRFVMYDDYIAEVQRVKDDYCEHIAGMAERQTKLQARIDELKKLLYEQRLNNEIHHDLIKAEGIEEMLKHFDLFDLDKDTYGFGEYLAKLRSEE